MCSDADDIWLCAAVEQNFRLWVDAGRVPMPGCRLYVDAS
jgi:hypothetical protein